MSTIITFILAMAMQTSPSPVQVISQESMSRVEDSKQAVARTSAEFAALWRQHAGDKKLPALDFASRTVVAVFLGTRTSSGFSAEITGTRESGGTLIIEWRERRPGRDEISAQVMTSPAVIASIPKFAGEIKFEKVEK